MNLKEDLKNLRNILSEKLNQPTIEKTTTTKTELTEGEKRMLEGFRQFREGDISPAAKEMANYFASIRNI